MLLRRINGTELMLGVSVLVAVSFVCRLLQEILFAGQLAQLVLNESEWWGWREHIGTFSAGIDALLILIWSPAIVGVGAAVARWLTAVTARKEPDQQGLVLSRLEWLAVAVQAGGAVEPLRRLVLIRSTLEFHRDWCVAPVSHLDLTHRYIVHHQLAAVGVLVAALALGWCAHYWRPHRAPVGLDDPDQPTKQPNSDAHPTRSFWLMGAAVVLVEAGLLLFAFAADEFQSAIAQLTAERVATLEGAKVALTLATAVLIGFIVAAAVFAWFADHSIERRRLPVAPSLAALTILLASVWAVVVGAETMRLSSENRLPVVAGYSFGAIPFDPIRGVGRDAMEESPGLVRSSGNEQWRWSLGGRPIINPSELREQLLAKRRIWESLHPGKRFPGSIYLDNGGSARIEELRQVLLVVQEAGYSKLQFTMVENDTQERPLLGRVIRVSATALTVVLVAKAKDCSRGVAVPLAAYARSDRTVADLVRFVRLARVSEPQVCLVTHGD